jgi:hypothetical protein
VTIHASVVPFLYACAISDPCAHTPVTIQPHPQGRAHHPRRSPVILLLWLIAGIACLLTGRLLLGAVLIVVGLLVGPGGVSIWGIDDGDDDVGSALTT